MDEVFLEILNRSVTAGWLMAAVILLRFLFKRAPKWISCLLWAPVAVRLICPFSLESTWSLIPDSEPLQETFFSEGYFHVNVPAQDTGEKEEGTALHSEASGSYAGTGHGTPLLSALRIVWLTGAGLMLAYGLYGYWSVYRRTRVYVSEGGGVRRCDGVDTPFILGVFRPSVYLPSGLEAMRIPDIVRHERAHIERHDHWWKPLGFMILCVYWFHPLCWISYILLCRDIEFACDERVIRTMDANGRRAYSEALLSCSVKQRAFTAYPPAFGEVGVKNRIRRVLNYKKPAFWLILLSAAAALAVVVCFSTDPEGKPADTSAHGTEAGKKYGTADADGAAETDGMTEADSAAPAKETAPSDESGQERLLLTEWMRAFVNRDGAGIVELSSPELREELLQRGLLTEENGRYGFGYSSPWPKSGDEDAMIVRYEYDGSSAELRYCAYTSDPHVTYWKEELTYRWEAGRYVVTGEKLTCYDEISSGAEFSEAYGGIISDTMMDYTKNQLGEELNEHALSSESGAYEALFSPEGAAVSLLNLSDKVRIERNGEESGGMVGLTVTFPQDGAAEKIAMIRPFGVGGIWVPADYRVDVLARWLTVDWEEVKKLRYTEDVPDMTGVLCIGEIPEQDIRVYGYNDEEIMGRGVAVDMAGSVSYFDWDYMTPRTIYPKLYWDDARGQLRLSFFTNTGTGLAAQDLYVLQYGGDGGPVASAWNMGDYCAALEKRITYRFNEGSGELVLVDRKTGEELAAATLSGGNVTGIELGNISEFELLEETVRLVVSAGYFQDGWAIAQYEGMPKLVFEVLMQQTQAGEIRFALGEVRTVF